MSKTFMNRGITVAATCLFLILSLNNLGGQGLNYDELDGAAPSFAYVGQLPRYFAALSFHNVPLLNMTYSGAIKTAMYGLYMRAFGQPFQLISWRLSGILMVGLGLLLFGLLVGDALGPAGLAALYFMLITDVTALLLTRYDWGPVAMALALRLIIIAVWIRGELSGKPKARETLLLVFLVGVSVFEKLSNVVLVIPLACMIVQNKQRRSRSHVLAGALGAIVGFSPLIFVNAVSWFQRGWLISLQPATPQAAWPAGWYLGQYLSLGGGTVVTGYILGWLPDTFNWAELASLSPLLLMLLVVALRRPSQIYRRLVWILMLCYLLVMIQLYFLPTWIHHWIVGTPFQYSAIAVFLSGLSADRIEMKDAKWRYLFVATLALISCVRLIRLASLEQSLSRGDSSVAWDGSLTNFAEFAARNSRKAWFLVGDWGIGTQMTCFMNGKDESLLEPFWNNFANLQQTLLTIKAGKKAQIYVVLPVWETLTTAEEKRALLEETSRVLQPEWKMVQAQRQIAHLRSLEVVEYRRRP